MQFLIHYVVFKDLLNINFSYCNKHPDSKKKNKTTVETNELALGSKSIVAGKKKGSVTSISASHFTVVFPAEYTRRCNFKKPSCLLLHTGKFFQELV